MTVLWMGLAYFFLGSETPMRPGLWEDWGFLMSYCVYHPQSELDSQKCARCEGWFCPNCYVLIDDFLLCADCKVEHVRDAYCGVQHGALDLASISQRFVAVFIDGLIFGIPYMLWILGLLATSTEEDASPVIAVFGVLIILFMTFGRVIYEGMMLQRRGQTLGKMAAKIKVVTPQGHDLRPGQAWGRAGARFLLDSCISIINYLPALFTKDRTSLHDLLAGTRVVRARK